MGRRGILSCMNNVHIFLQARGGVGKSTAASLLAQYLIDRHKSCICIDCDGFTKTLSQFKRLKAHSFDLDNAKTNERIYELFNNIKYFYRDIKDIQADEKVSFVVDVPSKNFSPVLNFIANTKKELYDLNIFVHTIITGQDSISDMLCVKQICNTVSGLCNICIWQNPFFGPVGLNISKNIRSTDTKKDFIDIESDPIYKENIENIYALIPMPNKNEIVGYSLFFERMIKNHLTFQELQDSNDFFVIEKQYLFDIRIDFYQFMNLMNL